jgi:3,4-dihydroxy-2-butanone 4-phosphate synthase
VLNDDGSIARGPALDELAVRFDLARVSIEALVAWRLSRDGRPVPRVHAASPTAP